MIISSFRIRTGQRSAQIGSDDSPTQAVVCQHCSSNLENCNLALGVTCSIATRIVRKSIGSRISELVHCGLQPSEVARAAGVGANAVLRKLYNRPPDNITP